MSGSLFPRLRHNTIVFLWVREELRELHAGQEDLPPGACRGTQRRPGRCSAAPRGKGRHLEKLQLRAKRIRSGGLDGVPQPCWKDHLSKNANKNEQQRHTYSYENMRERTPAASEIPPPEIPPPRLPLTEAPEAAWRDHQHGTLMAASGADVRVDEALNSSRDQSPLNTHFRAILEEHWRPEE